MRNESSHGLTACFGPGLTSFNNVRILMATRPCIAYGTLCGRLLTVPKIRNYSSFKSDIVHFEWALTHPHTIMWLLVSIVCIWNEIVCNW